MNNSVTENNRIGRAALPPVLVIFEKWEVSEEQQSRLLGLTPTEYETVVHDRVSFDFGDDLVLRIAYFLYIDAFLRSLFSNPHNVDRFIRQPNPHLPFNGKSPLDYMGSGEKDLIRDTYVHFANLCS